MHAAPHLGKVPTSNRAALEPVVPRDAKHNRRGATLDPLAVVLRPQQQSKRMEVLMSSVVKKRRKKITKHKLKKRLKRERFKKNR